MKNLVLLSIFLSLFVKVHGQTALIPDWYFNYLYQSTHCASTPRPIGFELLWTSIYSKSFLLNKLDSKNRYEIPMAITYLGMSKDTSLIKVLEPYVLDADEHITRAAIHAIGTIGGSKSAQILEDCWRNRDLDWSMTLEIVQSLDLICSPSSISLLREIKEKFKGYLGKRENLREKINTIIDRIERVNETDNSRKKVITDLISSLDHDESFSWAYFQIHRSKDKYYLQILRKIQYSMKILPEIPKGDISEDSLLDMNVNRQYDGILRLRLYIGEEKLTDEEEIYLSKKQELMPLVHRMRDIQEEISRLEPYKDNFMDK